MIGLSMNKIKGECPSTPPMWAYVFQFVSYLLRYSLLDLNSDPLFPWAGLCPIGMKLLMHGNVGEEACQWEDKLLYSRRHICRPTPLKQSRLVPASGPDLCCRYRKKQIVCVLDVFGNREMKEGRGGRGEEREKGGAIVRERKARIAKREGAWEELLRVP